MSPERKIPLSWKIVEERKPRINVKFKILFLTAQPFNELFYMHLSHVWFSLELENQATYFNLTYKNVEIKSSEKCVKTIVWFTSWVYLLLYIVYQQIRFRHQILDISIKKYFLRLHGHINTVMRSKTFIFLFFSKHIYHSLELPLILKHFGFL